MTNGTAAAATAAAAKVNMKTKCYMILHIQSNKFYIKNRKWQMTNGTAAAAKAAAAKANMKTKCYMILLIQIDTFSHLQASKVVPRHQRPQLRPSLSTRQRLRPPKPQMRPRLPRDSCRKAAPALSADGLRDWATCCACRMTAGKDSPRTRERIMSLT